MAGIDVSGPYEVQAEDLEYARPAGIPLLCRVYRPVGGTGPFPALVDVHGGAWQYFDRTADENFVKGLAACGMVVISLDFRQAPDFVYPTAVADVVAGIRWTRLNAARLNLDPHTLGLIGGSSGAHLLMLAALRPHAPEFLTTPVPGAENIDATVAYALPLWGILDPLERYHYLQAHLQDPPEQRRDPFFRPRRLMAAHDAFFGNADTMLQASVTRIVERGEAEVLPPLWTVHPELDENVTLAMTERFVDAYRAAGGQVELTVFPDVGHSFANFPGMEADFCIAGMRDFIHRQLTALAARRPPRPPYPGVTEALLAERQASLTPTVLDPKTQLPKPDRVAPTKLAHLVLRTAQFEEMKAFYCRLLNAKVVFSSSIVAFLTYDQEHHRLGLVHRTELEPNSPSHAGLEHVGFTFGSLAELLHTYQRLKTEGILPFWCVNHGTTTSLYYADPDANQVELQVDNFETLDALQQWFQAGAFRKNPIGVNFEPEDLLERYLSGEPVAELLKQGE